MPEMMMIFVVILLLFGAKKLPELARGMGKAMGEFKKARDEFEREITHAVKQAEHESIKEPVAIEPAATPVADAPAPVVAAAPVTAFPATPPVPVPHDPHVS